MALAEKSAATILAKFVASISKGSKYVPASSKDLPTKTRLLVDVFSGCNISDKVAYGGFASPAA